MQRSNHMGMSSDEEWLARVGLWSSVYKQFGLTDLNNRCRFPRHYKLLVCNNTDLTYYEATRRVCCSSVLTHSNNNVLDHHNGRISDKATWDTIAANDNIDGVTSIDVCNYTDDLQADIICLYGWKLAKDFLMLGVNEAWMAGSKVIPMLPEPKLFPIPYTDPSIASRYDRGLLSHIALWVKPEAKELTERLLLATV